MAQAVFFLPHVPKCAGTTVERHLARHLGPGGFWSPPKRTRRLPLELFGRKYARLPGSAEGVRAVSGHFIGRSAERLFAGREIRRALLLRDPAALVLSWYNYRMMRYRAEGLGAYPFRLHLLALPPDPVAHFLLERWFELSWPQMALMPAARKIALIDAELARFEIVADMAETDRLIATVSAALGIPAAAARANTATLWQGATGWTPLGAADLDPRDAVLLERRTRLDRYLWRRWALGEPVAADPGEVAPFLAAELVRPLHEIIRRRTRARSAPASGQFPPGA